MAGPSAGLGSRKERRASAFWRIVLGLILLALLYAWRIIDPVALRALLAHPGILALALAAALANIPLEAWRWHVLLRTQGFSLAFTRTARVFAASLFFANFLPGAAGGDLIRGAYLYKTAQGRRAQALSSIALDRLLGLTGFALLGLVAVLVRPIALRGPIEWLVLSLSGCGIAFVVLLVLVPRKGFWIRLAPPRLAQIAAALRLYARDRRSLGLALLLSIGIAALAVAPIALIAETVPRGALDTFGYAIAGVYALIANSLPATPGGIGLGETAFASACLMLSANGAHAAYGTAFLAFRCVFVVSTLPGLWLSLFEAGDIPRFSARTERNL